VILEKETGCQFTSSAIIREEDKELKERLEDGHEGNINEEEKVNHQRSQLENLLSPTNAELTMPKAKRGVLNSRPLPPSIGVVQSPTGYGQLMNNPTSKVNQVYQPGPIWNPYAGSQTGTELHICFFTAVRRIWRATIYTERIGYFHTDVACFRFSSSLPAVL